MAKILVVDDDPDITYAVALFLKKEGHEVTVAASRSEGMKALAAVKPDLMILDVMMEQPDDGIAMAQDLRRAGEKLPIIMLTSVGRVTGMSFDRDNDLVPVDAFFEKPVRPEELLRKLGELLKQGVAMLVNRQQQLQEQIKALVERHGRSRSALMPILQDVQRQHASVPDFAMQVIADELRIHPAEVYGVVSFYAFLHHEPRGRFQIRLCGTISCDLAGKARVARQLENELGIHFGQTTPDGRFSLEWASCLGMCDQGPALLVNERVYTRVTPDQVHQIVEDCRKVFGAHAAQPAHA